MESLLDIAVLTVFLILLLAVFVWRDRKTWQFCEQIVVGAIGILFLIPQYSLGYFGILKEGQSDDFLLWSSRILGLLLLSHALLIHLNRSSVDTYTQVILLYPGILVGCLVLMIYFVDFFSATARERTEEFADQKKVGLLFVLFWLCVNSFSVAQTEYFGRSQLYSRLNITLRFDGFTILLASLLFFAFPEFVISQHTTVKVLSASHVLMARWIGAILISSAIVSMHAPSFLMETDKRNVLLIRIWSNILILLSMIYLLSVKKLLTTSTQFAVILTSISTANAAIGYYSPHETDGYKVQED